MDNFLKKERWSPYAVGALIGVLSWLTFYFSSEHIGSTLAYVKFTALVENIFAKGHVESSPYFQRYLTNKPFVVWQLAFVVAIFFGSFAAGRLSGSKRVEHVPTLWSDSFGPSKVKRYIGAFIGGFLVLFGARIAGGCTSGHAVSGGLQLAVSGYIFMGAVFAAGIPTALILYRRR